MAHWSDDRVDRLKSLWQAGLSASQVAHALGDVSRNAVIGKVHRLGLAGRVGSRHVSRPRPPATPRPRPPTLCKRFVAMAEEAPFKFEDGSFATMRTIDSRMCRWPIGDPANSTFHFCGRNPKSGLPYCETHDLRAHQLHRKPKPARRSPPAKARVLS